MHIFDTAANCTRRTAAIKKAGYDTVGRYLSSDTRPNSKNITPKEAKALADAGIKLFLVWETYGGTHSELNASLGSLHAKQAAKQAKAVGAPNGVTIYFAVDSNPQGAVFTRMLEYFKAIKASNIPFKIGVYGPGKVCGALLDKGYVDRAWLANAKGWSGYKAFLASNRWSLLQHLPTQVAGMGVDPNTENGEFGAFIPYKGTIGAEHAGPGTIGVATGVAVHQYPEWLWLIIPAGIALAIGSYFWIKYLKGKH